MRKTNKPDTQKERLTPFEFSHPRTEVFFWRKNGKIIDGNELNSFVQSCSVLKKKGEKSAKMRGDIVERIGAFNDMLEKILKLYLDSALFDVFPRILLILFSIVIIRTLMGVIYPQFSTVARFPRFSFWLLLFIQLFVFIWHV